MLLLFCTTVVLLPSTPQSNKWLLPLLCVTIFQVYRGGGHPSAFTEKIYQLACTAALSYGRPGFIKRFV